jgi:superkiller protein 3
MPALLGMAEVYIKLGLHADAIKCYQQALDKAEFIEKETQHNKQALLPVWIGLADAYAVAALDHWSNGFYGRAAENCQQALTTLVIAATLSSTTPSQFGSIWKITGDVCLLSERLSMYTQLFSSDTILQLWKSITNHKNALQVWTLEQLTSENNDIDEHTWHWQNANSFRLAMIKLAIFAYAHAMQDWSDTELCNDLSLAFYRLYGQQHHSEKLLKSAIDCVQAGLKNRADSSLLWNLLGVYTMKIDARISQHAFIQAIRLDDKVSSHCHCIN